MPAEEAVLLLEQAIKADELADFKHRQRNYHSSLPLWANGGELPPPPEPPDWLSDDCDDD